MNDKNMENQERNYVFMERKREREVKGRRVKHRRMKKAFEVKPIFAEVCVQECCFMKVLLISLKVGLYICRLKILDLFFKSYHCLSRTLSPRLQKRRTR